MHARIAAVALVAATVAVGADRPAPLPPPPAARPAAPAPVAAPAEAVRFAPESLDGIAGRAEGVLVVEADLPDPVDDLLPPIPAPAGRAAADEGAVLLLVGSPAPAAAETAGVVEPALAWVREDVLAEEIPFAPEEGPWEDDGAALPAAEEPAEEFLVLEGAPFVEREVEVVHVVETVEVVHVVPAVTTVVYGGGWVVERCPPPAPHCHDACRGRPRCDDRDGRDRDDRDCDDGAPDPVADRASPAPRAPAPRRAERPAPRQDPVYGLAPPPAPGRGGPAPLRFTQEDHPEMAVPTPVAEPLREGFTRRARGEAREEPARGPAPLHRGETVRVARAPEPAPEPEEERPASPRTDRLRGRASDPQPEPAAAPTRAERRQERREEKREERAERAPAPRAEPRRADPTPEADAPPRRGRK